MNKKKAALINGRELMVIGIIAAMVIVFSILSPTFRTYPTLVSVLDSVYYVALMAIGVTFPLITGGVDLATLCTCMITRGLGPALCGGFGVSWPSALSAEGTFRKIFKFTSAGGTVIPVGIILIVVLVIVMSFVLNHTKMGRYTIAIGSNKEATKLAGVNVKFFHVMTYVICGFFSGLAGVAYAATYATIYPGAGAGFEMDAIGGAIVGGVSASGGSGTIFGAFLGVIVISLMKIGLPFIGLQANWQQIFTGLVLLAAVLVDVLKKKK